MQKKLLILVVVASAVAITLIFVWQKEQSNKVPPTANVVKPNTAQEEMYPQHIEAIQGSDEVWYNIPEYGVRMRLNKEFAEDLVYRFVHEKNSSGEEWGTVYFSLKNLLAVAPNCTSVNTFFKSFGNMREMAKTDEYLAARVDNYVQIGNYYYGLADSADICWDSSLEQKVREVFPGKYSGGGAKYVSEGIKTLQLIPWGTDEK